MLVIFSENGQSFINVKILSSHIEPPSNPQPFCSVFHIIFSVAISQDGCGSFVFFKRSKLEMNK